GGGGGGGAGKAAAASPHKQVGGPPPPEKVDWRSYLGVFRYVRRAVQLVWSTNRTLTFGLAFGSLIAGTLPAGIAYVSRGLVNAVLAAKAHEASRDVALY